MSTGSALTDTNASHGDCSAVAAVFKNGIRIIMKNMPHIDILIWYTFLGIRCLKDNYIKWFRDAYKST